MSDSAKINLFVIGDVGFQHNALEHRVAIAMERFQALRRLTHPRMKHSLLVASILALASVTAGLAQEPTPPPKVKTVFLIVMENHPWSLTNSQTQHPPIKGSPDAPFINSLLKIGAHSEHYFSPKVPGLIPKHMESLGPSLPNYLWLEAGKFFHGGDFPPSQHHFGETAHLVTLLNSAGVSWKAYEEGISGKSCPDKDVDKTSYAVRHDPFVYFDDVRSNEAYCTSHIRPHEELADDLKSGHVARYNFITPNTCHDMHDRCDPKTSKIKHGDNWLKGEMAMLMDSQAYKDDGAIFVTWDESECGDRPIGLIVLSPLAKADYSDDAKNVRYTHSSTLKTLQELFGIKPTLGDTANANVPDLSDLFQLGTIPANQ